MVETEHVVAWMVYVTAATVCCFIWWRITSGVAHSGWRDLARGIVIVLLFTPWYAGPAPEYLAPAIVVLLMDILLAGAKNGMQGGMALLFSSFAMLLALTVRALWFKRHKSKGVGPTTV